jgi:hypothetical protein
MRSILALGVVSLAVAAGMVACGDDSGDDGPSLGGSGGASGGGSGGGGAGGTGGGTGGTSAGTGGTSGGTGGTGGAPQVPAANCNGCVQLTVPFGGTVPTGATNFQAQYEFTAPATAAPFDLSEVNTITWRLQALTTNANYFVQLFVQNAPPENESYSGAYNGNVALTAAAFAPNAWVNVSIDVGALAGGIGGDAGVPDAGGADSDAGVVLTTFDKAYVRAIGIQVGALAATTGTGVVSIEVDSVTVDGDSNFTSKTFDANTEGLTLNTFQAPTGSVPTAFR